MTDDPLVYKIALSMMKRVKAPLVHHLYDCGLTAEDFFKLSMSELAQTLNLPRSRGFEQAERDEALFAARNEVKNMLAHGIKGHFLMDSDYPTRLLAVEDAPVMLYQLGQADLDGQHVISLVGTRKPTPYGSDFTRNLVTDLSAYFPDLTVVSGLAYGIDAAAHMAALEAGLATVGVVAHGLNMIYPSAHRDLARKIVYQGGALVSEYPFGSKPYRQRFLERNRIVAALSDVTVVAESDIKGGAMSTANTAFSYSRDVMALPGRITDKLSSGCNHLIRKEKARIITGVPDLVEVTGWHPLDLKIDTTQRNLFPELEGEPKLIYEALRYEKEPMQTDRLHQLTLIPISRMLALLGEMEFDGIVIRHPGSRYSVS